MKTMDVRKCMKCKTVIPANTSEIYDPGRINPKRDKPGQGFYLELCAACYEKKTGRKVKPAKLIMKG